MIRANGLRRTFNAGGETVEAVRDVTFDVAAGELLALLGPNGAGKSTTLRLLATLLPPTSGSVRIAGIQVAREPARVRGVIGYVGQRNAAGENQRVRDELVTQGRCYGMDTRRARGRADEVLELMGIGDLAARTPGTLSGGQRRRVDLALGLVQRPAVLLLDEPSAGLDPRARAALWERIGILRRETGVTIVLSTHFLDEADQVADRVVVVDRGEVVADGTVGALKAGPAGGDRIHVTTTRAECARAAARVAGRMAGTSEVTTDGTTVRVRTADADAALPTYLRLLDHERVAVLRAGVHHPSLDDVFVALTGRALRDSDD